MVGIDLNRVAATPTSVAKDPLSDLLPEEEDLLYEEELLRNPYHPRTWLRYIAAKKASSAKKRYLLYERALQALPGSYKVRYDSLGTCKYAISMHSRYSQESWGIRERYEVEGQHRLSLGSIHQYTSCAQRDAHTHTHTRDRGAVIDWTFVSVDVFLFLGKHEPA